MELIISINQARQKIWRVNLSLATLGQNTKTQALIDQCNIDIDNALKSLSDLKQELNKYKL